MLDEASFLVKAGDGGDGRVSFRREKYVPRGGPDGGDGGNGGSVYIQTNPNLDSLDKFAGKTIFKAENGQPGGMTKKHGKNGEDIILEVPLGTIVYDAKTNSQIIDMDKQEIRFCLANGGKGGRGNYHFKSATNQTPRFAERGQEGREREIQLQLKILAHIGLIGLPNAGKSSLLSVLTAARPKIANYPFTTLSPNLGAMKHPESKDGIIIADIPGLIEGASQGKGLGTKFLKHIERCKLIVYVLYPKEENLKLSNQKIAKGLWDQKQKVEKELKFFNPLLLKLPNISIVNKVDLLPKKSILTIKTFFKSKKQKVTFTSALTKFGIAALTRKLAIFTY